jgi:hypothetical protein
MLNEIKRVMISQCGPVLMGKKPAALFPLRSKSCLDCLSGLLPGNARLFVLRETEGRPLVLLYQKALLEAVLSCGTVRGFLGGLGYPAAASIFPVLMYLKARFTGSDFPHEVGLFLGYPLEDVAGFVQHRGQNYKFCGYWKVYGDVEEAKRLFRQYDWCRECMKSYINVAFFENRPKNAIPWTNSPEKG